MKPDIKIGALSTFLQQLDKLVTERNRLLFFRGHSKASFQPKPSIFRNPGWIENEATMLKELILRCPNDFTGELTTFECLVKMQHYGLPTRLLDVTSNPLAALFFACEIHERDDEDGEVIAFCYDTEAVKYFDSDTVSIIANLSRRPPGFAVPDHETYDPADVAGSNRFNSDEDIRKLLHDIRNEKPHFLSVINPVDLERVVCVKPLLNNPRIIRQEGAFLLFGCDKTKEQPAKLEGSAIIARLTINRDEKRNLLDQLHTLGINRATMFPEIESVSTQIKQSHFVPSIDLDKLTSSQERVFELLRKGPPRSAREVAKIAGMKPATASQVIGKLRNIGAVEFVGSGRDRLWKLVEKLEIVNGNSKMSGNARPGKPYA